MLRVFARIVIGLIVAVLVAYAGDYLSLHFRIPSREPIGSVVTRRSYAVKQKNGKLEYYFDPPAPEPCVRSVFPQMGYTPCWYLERHRATQTEL